MGNSPTPPSSPLASMSAHVISICVYSSKKYLPHDFREFGKVIHSFSFFYFILLHLYFDRLFVLKNPIDTDKHDKSQCGRGWCW